MEERGNAEEDSEERLLPLLNSVTAGGGGGGGTMAVAEEHLFSFVGMAPSLLASWDCAAKSWIWSGWNCREEREGRGGRGGFGCTDVDAMPRNAGSRVVQ